MKRKQAVDNNFFLRKVIFVSFMINTAVSHIRTARQREGKKGSLSKKKKFS